MNTRPPDRNRVAWLAVLLLASAGTGWAADSPAEQLASPSPLVRAHAHNDYYHPRPLLDALECGFCSVEADVFLREGELLVGHSLLELHPARTLEALYLDPLRQRVAELGGRVFSGGPQFTLLIDFKSEGAPTYAALREALQPYASMLTPPADGSHAPAAVTIIVSGNRPIAQIVGDPQRLVGIDGRVSDLAGGLERADVMPLISDRWGSHFRWQGSGPMPADERQHLRQLVQQTHQQGRRLRFWATPELPEVWDALLAAEVDLIGTDRLAALQGHLQRRLKQRSGEETKVEGTPSAE